MKAINWDNVKTAEATGRVFNIRVDPRDMASYIVRTGYAWPGGYELVLLTDDGGCLCRNCVRANYEQVYGEASPSWRNSGTGWRPAAIGAIGVNIDDGEELSCDHCGQMLVQVEAE